MEEAFENCKNKSARLLQSNDIPSVLDLFFQQEFNEKRNYKLTNLVDLSFNVKIFFGPDLG